MEKTGNIRSKVPEEASSPPLIEFDSEMDLLLSKHVFAFEDGAGNSKNFIDTEVLEKARNASLIEKLIAEIKNSDHDVANLSLPFNSTPPKVRLDRLGRKFVHRSKIVLPIFETDEFHIQNPWVKLFLDQARACAEIFDHFEPKKTDNNQICPAWLNSQAIATRLNEAINSIRREARSEAFQRKINHIQRACNKNRKSFLDYIKGLFNVRGRILVVRIDLYAPSDEREILPIDMPLKEAIKNRDRLIDNVKKKYKKSYLGYAIKAEYGELRRLHFHTVFFFKGDEVRQDITIGQDIGAVWRNEIMGGLGLHYNCNLSKQRYQTCGIGMLHYGDPSIWAGLQKVADYMTKPDYYLRHLLSESPDCKNAKLFVKGQIQKTDPKKGGRPRGKTPFKATPAAKSS